LVLKFGWWSPASVDEAVTYGTAQDRALVHRRTKTEPLRRKILSELTAAEKRLRNALSLLERFDALFRADPEKVESEARFLARDRKPLPASEVTALIRRMRRWERDDRRLHPEYWQGKRVRMPWERRVIDVINTLAELHESIAAETVRVPRHRPVWAARDHALRVLHAEGRADREIAAILIERGVEKGSPAQVEKRVRSALNERIKPGVRRSQKSKR
jgi:hypothetical protein